MGEVKMVLEGDDGMVKSFRYNEAVCENVETILKAYGSFRYSVGKIRALKSPVV
jgi:hypothetical protein